jgi:hypothetical protein
VAVPDRIDHFYDPAAAPARSATSPRTNPKACIQQDSGHIVMTSGPHPAVRVEIGDDARGALIVVVDRVFSSTVDGALSPARTASPDPLHAARTAIAATPMRSHRHIKTSETPKGGVKLPRFSGHLPFAARP